MLKGFRAVRPDEFFLDRAELSRVFVSTLLQKVAIYGGPFGHDPTSLG